MFYRKDIDRALIAGDASAEAIETLIFMALHDEFRLGKTRVEKIFNAWNQLPNNTTYYENVILQHGYNRGRMNRNFVNKMMIIIGADKIEEKPLRNHIHDCMLDTVIVMLYILFCDYGFTAQDIHRLEKRIYNYCDILLDPEKYGVTIWRFMASIRYELNIRCDILKEFEKEYGRVDLGPKWGLNMKTGRPRKRNEVIA